MISRIGNPSNEGNYVLEYFIMEPLYCGHPQHSLKCPDWRGAHISGHNSIAGTHNSVLIKETSLFQGVAL